MNRFPLFGIAFLLLMANSVLSQDVRYNFDNTADFSKFKTYKWVILKNAARVDDLTDKQIKTALDAGLWPRRASRKSMGTMLICTLATRRLSVPNSNSPHSLAAGVMALADAEGGTVPLVASPLDRHPRSIKGSSRISTKRSARPHRETSEVVPATAGAALMLRKSGVSRNTSWSRLPKSSINFATIPVHPVWWLAPMPAPLSPWKYS